jgi:hypothetical protein
VLETVPVSRVIPFWTWSIIVNVLKSNVSETGFVSDIRWQGRQFPTQMDPRSRVQKYPTDPSEYETSSPAT